MYGLGGKNCINPPRSDIPLIGGYSIGGEFHVYKNKGENDR